MRTETRDALRKRPSRAAPAAAVDPVGRTPDQERALAAHRAHLEAARHRGVWTDADAIRHRELLAAMAREDRLAALSSLVTRVNSRQFRVEARIPF